MDFFGRPVTLTKKRRAPGDAGAIGTLKRMAELARRSSIHPSVVSMARAIIQPAGRNQVGEQIELIRQWVQDHTKWLPDPLGAEYLIPPELLLPKIAATGQAQGDCDDVALLAAALLRAVGIPAGFRAVAFTPARNLSHVFALGWNGRNWCELDTTRPYDGGRPRSRSLTLRIP